MTLNEEKDEDVVVEEGSQIERGTVTHATVRFITETSVTSGSRVKRVLSRALLKWRTSLLPFVKRRMETLSWRKDHKLKRGTVSLGDTCKREILQRSIRDKRIPREACFDLGDVKVENHIVTFNEEEHEDRVVEE